MFGHFSIEKETKGLDVIHDVEEVKVKMLFLVNIFLFIFKS